jgi:protein TonB
MTPDAAVPHRGSAASAPRWIVCGLMVLVLHAAALLSLWQRPEDVPEPAVPSAVLLELAPEPVAPPPSAEPPLALAPPPAVEPPPPAEPQPPEPPPPPEPVATPEPPLRPTPPPEVVLPKPPPPRPVARPPRPHPTRPTPPAQPATASQTPQTTSSETTPTASAAPVRAAPAPNAAPATWQSALSAHLALFKRYPANARRRGEEGVAQVRFAMDHAGHVLSVTLVRGSGHTDLDQEALAWVQRAQPLPQPPPEMGQGPFDLMIPLRFELH